MQTLLILILGLSSLTSIYYVIKGRKAYQTQLLTNAELSRLMKQLEVTQTELNLEHQRIKQIASQLNSGAVYEPTPPGTSTSTDQRRKPWLN